MIHLCPMMHHLIRFQVAEPFLLHKLLEKTIVDLSPFVLRHIRHDVLIQFFTWILDLFYLIQVIIFLHNCSSFIIVDFICPCLLNSFKFLPQSIKLISFRLFGVLEIDWIIPMGWTFWLINLLNLLQSVFWRVIIRSILRKVFLLQFIMFPLFPY